MKQLLSLLLVMTLILVSCKKELKTLPQQSLTEENTSRNLDQNGHLKQTKTFSSDVLLRWTDFQLTLYKANAAFTGGVAGARYPAITGIAAYESVVPGMPAYRSLAGQLTDLSGLPSTEPGKAYYWPEALNAAMAYVTTNLFPSAGFTGGKAAQDLAIKNFSDGLYAEFMNAGTSEELLLRSQAFGIGVATKVMEWANTDKTGWPADFASYPNLNPAIGTDAVGDNSFDISIGKWVRTAVAPAALPYWGYTRLSAPGSLNGIQRTSPYTYSTASGSSFRNMILDIYNKSFNPHGYSEADRQTIANYYAAAGYGGGYYLNIVKQVLVKANPTLDISALVMAQAGIAGFDAGIGCIQVKYADYVVRPQTYIRKVLGFTGWLPSIGQPNHPEYPSGHSTLAGAYGEVLIKNFGDHFSFTDSSFVNFTGAAHFDARFHSSIQDFQHEIGDSRVYGQIHYPESCDAGRVLGTKVADNVLNTLRFLK